VLPFANLSNDPSQNCLADGVTESLTPDLSRLRGSFVIAVNTAFTFKRKNVDIREIGKELGVRYVLEGSVQRDAGRMRVNVQLIDAETGNHLWADRFDKPAADLFEMQDEIVARLANQLGAELISAEARRAERVSNPDSMYLYFQGQSWLNRGINPENMAQARGFFERAVAPDPNNLDALLGVGRVDYSVGGAYLSNDRDARLAAAEATIVKVLSLPPNDALADEIMGGVLNQTGRSDQGIAEFERVSACRPVFLISLRAVLVSFAVGRMRHCPRFCPRGHITSGDYFLAYAGAVVTRSLSLGAVADDHLRAHQDTRKNERHRRQWFVALTRYCAPIRDLPVDAIDTEAVLSVLKSLRTRAPDTASRVRGMIERVLDAARAAISTTITPTLRAGAVTSTNCCRTRTKSARTTITLQCLTTPFQPSWPSSRARRVWGSSRSRWPSSPPRGRAKCSACNGTRSISTPSVGPFPPRE
jgi:TolB-like protein